MPPRSRSSITTAICRRRRSRRTSVGVTLPNSGSAATTTNGGPCAPSASMKSSAPVTRRLGRSSPNTPGPCRSCSATRSTTGRTSNWPDISASTTACWGHPPHGTFSTAATKCSRSLASPRAGSWSARMLRWCAPPTTQWIPWNTTAPSRQIKTSRSACCRLGVRTKRF